MKEKDFQRWVVDLFLTHGWTVKHVPTPMRPTGRGGFVPDPRGAGLPDLLLIHDDPPRVVWAEVKNEDGVLSDEQKLVLGKLRAVALYTREYAATPGTPAPLGVFVFAPGSEPLIEAIASGQYAAAA